MIYCFPANCVIALIGILCLWNSGHLGKQDSPQNRFWKRDASSYDYLTFLLNLILTVTVHTYRVQYWLVCNEKIKCCNCLKQNWIFLEQKGWKVWLLGRYFLYSVSTGCLRSCLGSFEAPVICLDFAILKCLILSLQLGFSLPTNLFAVVPHETHKVISFYF